MKAWHERWSSCSNLWKGYTHCLMRGPMSLPETLEMDLRKAWVDRSIWLHMWLWYFWDEAVLARLRSLLNTWRKASQQSIKMKTTPVFCCEVKRETEGTKSSPATWTPCWSCFLSASSPGGLYTGTSCSTPRTMCEGAWWKSEGGELDWRKKRSLVSVMQQTTH